MEVSSEVRESIDKLVDYSYSDEQKHYEENNEVEITDEEINNPELLEDQDHIFYHILVIQQFLNQ